MDIAVPPDHVLCTWLEISHKYIIDVAIIYQQIKHVTLMSPHLCTTDKKKKEISKRNP